MKVDNCVYCDQFETKHSIQCQGYMSYCKKLKRKINVYKDFKDCVYNAEDIDNDNPLEFGEEELESDR